MNGINFFRIVFLFLFSIFSFAKDTVLIDVRTSEEFNKDSINNAIHIEWTEISKKVDELKLSKNDTIFLYCRSGNRSGKAQKILKQNGYLNVINLGGIIEAKEKLKELAKNN